LDTLAAKDALARIVSVKGVRHVDRIRLRFVRVLLVLDFERESSVMNPAILVVVVAYSAIQHVVAEYGVIGFCTGSHGGI
jgi:hypothetical protein